MRVFIKLIIKKKVSAWADDDLIMGTNTINKLRGTVVLRRRGRRAPLIRCYHLHTLTHLYSNH